MELSREFVKNLLASLRTMNLAIGAISFGLISNVMFVVLNTAANQREELRHLLTIQDRLKSYSLGTLMTELATQSHIFAGNYVLTLSIDPTCVFLRNPLIQEITVPSVVHPMYHTDEIYSDNDNHLSLYSAIRDIKTLRQFRWFWDGLASHRNILSINPLPLLSGIVVQDTNKLLVSADVINTKREVTKFLSQALPSMASQANRDVPSFMSAFSRVGSK
jgi:hypothetical protein